MRPIGLIVFLSFFMFTASAQESPERKGAGEKSTSENVSITIGGNVYGGGNQGNVDGNSTVTVKAGNIVGSTSSPGGGKVFGGARMANIGGRTYVNIDGEHAISDIFITEIYGGNDISGTIGTSTVPVRRDVYYTAEEAAAYNEANSLNEGDDGYKTINDVKTTENPNGLTEVLTGSQTKETNPEKNAIDNTWNTFVRTSRSTKVVEMSEGETRTEEPYAIIAGSLFGGGNGDYTYRPLGTNIGTESDPIITTTHDVLDNSGNVIASSSTGFTRPELAKTYLEINGGEIAHIYGGGNNATVTENTTICINNQSNVLKTLIENYAEGTGMSEQTIFDYLQSFVKLSKFQTDIANRDYNMARVFGGNNKADMHIRPTWNIQQGIIRDLYSGGNEGSMTSEYGLLLDIDPISANSDNLSIMNVYGGCRRADVRPSDENGSTIQVKQLTGYRFPQYLSARTLVRGGKITNVYGGNDISGRVYGGNAVGIYTSISGDVYGGGNGSYAYTDQANLVADNYQYKDIFKDFYYTIPEGKSSVEALNAFRPNAEQVSIRLKGTDAEHPTIIGGSVYLGGNCASISSENKNPRVELRMGSHVIADKVFLGNNGENMVNEDILKLYKEGVDPATGEGGGSTTYSSLNLKDESKDENNLTIFDKYMLGCAMNLKPQMVVDTEKADGSGDSETYISGSSFIGSLYCGGNKGSMTYKGLPSESVTFDFKFESENKEPLDIIVYDKVVGGSNNANVAAGTYNVAHEGGILGSSDEWESYTYTDGKIKPRIELNLHNIKIMPKRWNDMFKRVSNGPLTRGKEYYATQLRSTKFIADGSETADDDHTYWELETPGTKLEWNTAKWIQSKENFDKVDADDVDADTRLLGGNVYGGCYESGHVNGNVIINIKKDLMVRDDVFGSGTDASGVNLENQREDLLTVAMSVFGGGYGKDTEIWGSTTVNHDEGYCFQIFGGSEQGMIGKPDASGNHHFNKKIYKYNEAYSTNINLRGSVEAGSDTDQPAGLAETEYIYGGGCEGDVCGNTTINLGKGRIYDSFGGACDANILGHAETYIGRSGVDASGNDIPSFPWIRDNVYGANDFGGKILGEKDFKERLRATDIYNMVHGEENDGTKDVLKANAYVEYLQGHVGVDIFGGNYGDYDYSDPEYKPSSDVPDIVSAFVHIRPQDNNKNAVVGKIFGGGEGHSGYREGDNMQDRSYVLVDIPQGITNFSGTEVFGAGSNNGLGMDFDPVETFNDNFDPDRLSAIVDLMHGEIANVYGGSYNEGVTARSVVNVPYGSDIKLSNIFGGAYGTKTLPPCDVFESNVNYYSEDARVSNIYGGNHQERRTLYANVNIYSPVWSNYEKGYLAKVFGAGLGENTWSEYTEVNLYGKTDNQEGDYTGARVYEVYGGGHEGHVLCAESVQKYMSEFFTAQGCTSLTDPKWIDAWTLGKYYKPDTKAVNPFHN